MLKNIFIIPNVPWFYSIIYTGFFLYMYITKTMIFFYNVLCIVITMILLNYMYTYWCRLVAYPEINLWGVTRYLFWYPPPIQFLNKNLVVLYCQKLYHRPVYKVSFSFHTTFPGIALIYIPKVHMYYNFKFIYYYMYLW